MRFNVTRLREDFRGFSKDDILYAMAYLGSEGMRVYSCLAQIRLTQELGGTFVGDKVHGWDIELGEHRIELKTTVSPRKSGNGKCWTVGMRSFVKTKEWTHLIHFTPQIFSDHFTEDKYILFESEDLDNMIKYSYCSGAKRSNNFFEWSTNLYNLEDFPKRIRKKDVEKWEFLRSRIKTKDEILEYFRQKNI